MKIKTSHWQKTWEYEYFENFTKEEFNFAWDNICVERLQKIRIPEKEIILNMLYGNKNDNTK